ncbi:MAG: HDOD domain-containing protein [Myxococcales bacterium]|nr:HDOD domain-containing protein [Myxococcales bacterium]MCB9647393.1 HDOD domain-containing protein [Deltaproteobacteria bacterium]
MTSTPRDFAAFVERNLEIPTIPDVAARALREMGNPRADGLRISGIISRDPGLTTRVLQLANSAAYGLRRKVTTLEQAASILGFNRLKTLVISASCRQLYKHFGWVELELWLHSVAAAGATQLITQAARVPMGTEAFVAGLIHDVGKVVMNNGEPDAYRQVAEAHNGDRAIEDYEREVFGFTHSEVGALLVRRWELAPELEACALMHHEPELLSTVDEGAQGLVQAVMLADEICHREGLGTPPRESEIPLEETDPAIALGLGEDAFPDLLEAIRASFEEDQQLFK